MKVENCSPFAAWLFLDENLRSPPQINKDWGPQAKNCPRIITHQQSVNFLKLVSRSNNTKSDKLIYRFLEVFTSYTWRNSVILSDIIIIDITCSCTLTRRKHESNYMSVRENNVREYLRLSPEKLNYWSISVSLSAIFFWHRWHHPLEISVHKW